MKQLTACLLCLWAFWSCQKGKNDESILPVPKPQPKVDSIKLVLKGGLNAKESFTVQYNGSWSLSTKPANIPWLSFSTTKGTGTTKVLVTVLESNITEAAKSASIVITADNDTTRVANILLTQKQYEFTAWKNVLGGAENDEFSAALPTKDGGYIAVGSTLSKDGDVNKLAGKKDVWIVKTDGDGNKLWEKSYGGSEDDNGNAIIAASDGGYIIVGRTASSNGDVTSNHGGEDAWILKIDANGKLIWQKTYGGSSYEQAFAVTPTPDGNYLVAATTSSQDGDVSGLHLAPGQSGQGDAWLLKIDPDGNKLWAKAYGGTSSEMAISITKSQDGGFVVLGFSDAFKADGDVGPSHGSLDVWVFKVNASGVLQWQKSFGGTNVDFGRSIASTPDGGYIISGYTMSDDGNVSGQHGAMDAWILKLDASGNFVWQNSLGGTGNEEAYSILPISSGGYIVAGSTSSADGNISSHYGNDDAWILKLDNNGGLIWQKTYGGSGSDIAKFITPGGGGTFIIAGSTTSADGDVKGQHGKEDAWLIRLKE